MAFTTGTATFQNGSATATNVTLNGGSLAFFASGTAVFIQSQNQFVEAVGLPKNAQGEIVESQFLLRKAWTGAGGSFEFVAFDTIEGLRDAVQAARGFSAQLKAVLDSVSANTAGNSIAKRTSNGRLKVANATDDNDAVAKGQLGAGAYKAVGTEIGQLLEVGAGGLLKVGTNTGNFNAPFTTQFLASAEGDRPTNGGSQYYYGFSVAGSESAAATVSMRDDLYWRFGGEGDPYIKVWDARNLPEDNLGLLDKSQTWTGYNKFERNSSDSSNGTATYVNGAGGAVFNSFVSQGGVNFGSTRRSSELGLAHHSGQSYEIYTFGDRAVLIGQVSMAIARNLSVNGNLSTSGSKNFRITNPVNENEWLYHSAVESDSPKTMYSYEIEVGESLTATAGLPDWFNFINGDSSRLLTSPVRHFGRSYAEIIDGELKVIADQAGIYNVLIIAERQDAGVANWVLTEYKIKFEPEEVEAQPVGVI